MSDRIPYLDLAPEDKEELHAWLHDHQIALGRVPVEADFEFDQAAGEWRIPLFWVDANGRKQLDATGEDIRRVVVRRRELRPLPWPRFGLRLVRTVNHVSFDGVDLTPYISDISVGGQAFVVSGGKS